ncbi:hypothetical protein BDV93DRAFT_586952 [Ceratobasidium sp. AG-I]|nr:hypothetical protein BDV93DRAFT_586952 [Ceratobasidium sp. AG-I]
MYDGRTTHRGSYGAQDDGLSGRRRVRAHCTAPDNPEASFLSLSRQNESVVQRDGSNMYRHELRRARHQNDENRRRQRFGDENRRYTHAVRDHEVTDRLTVSRLAGNDGMAFGRGNESGQGEGETENERIGCVMSFGLQNCQLARWFVRLPLPLSRYHDIVQHPSAHARSPPYIDNEHTNLPALTCASLSVVPAPLSLLAEIWRPASSKHASTPAQPTCRGTPDSTLGHEQKRVHNSPCTEWRRQLVPTPPRATVLDVVPLQPTFNPTRLQHTPVHNPQLRSADAPSTQYADLVPIHYYMCTTNDTGPSMCYTAKRMAP